MKDFTGMCRGGPHDGEIHASPYRELLLHEFPSLEWEIPKDTPTPRITKEIVVKRYLYRFIGYDHSAYWEYVGLV
jgi:hypothetical protein